MPKVYPKVKWLISCFLVESLHPVSLSVINVSVKLYLPKLGTSPGNSLEIWGPFWGKGCFVYKATGRVRITVPTSSFRKFWPFPFCQCSGSKCCVMSFFKTSVHSFLFSLSSFQVVSLCLSSPLLPLIQGQVTCENWDHGSRRSVTIALQGFTQAVSSM